MCVCVSVDNCSPVQRECSIKESLFIVKLFAGRKLTNQKKAFEPAEKEAADLNANAVD